MVLVLDTGPLLAALDAADQDHRTCAALLLEASEDLVIPTLVLAELDYWCHQRLHGDVWLTFLDDVLEGAYRVEHPTMPDLRRCAELQRRYRDLRLGVVDASVIALCERLREGKVATLDHRLFATVRPAHVNALDLLPRPRPRADLPTLPAMTRDAGRQLRYEGHVEPGGPAIARQVVLPGGAEVEIRKRSVGPMDNNAYLLTDLATGEALLIDAAADADLLLEMIGERKVAAILTTHGHADHWQALAEVAQATGAETLLHLADAAMVPHPASIPAQDGQTVTFGSAEVTLIHNPGHTPGSTSALLGGTHLFTGDTLFPGGLGRSTPGTFPAMFDVVVEKLFALPDETWVYPGHGDDTTLGRERPSIEEWRQRGW